MTRLARYLTGPRYAGLTITRSLGRHLNDETVSFYMKSPAGFEVEVGWDAVIVDDASWCDREAAGNEIWGQRLRRVTGVSNTGAVAVVTAATAMPARYRG